jgi:uncharacterized protein YecT (DUF1311 family)
MAGETGGDCLEDGKQGQQPYNACLTGEVALTTANYTAYSKEIRAIIALDVDVTGSRPLKPADAARRLEEVKSGWTNYLEQICSLAEDRWQPGSIAPSQRSNCQLKLIRNRMRELWELDFILR